MLSRPLGLPQDKNILCGQPHPWVSQPTQVWSKSVILPFGHLFVGCMDGLLNSFANFVVLLRWRGDDVKFCSFWKERQACLMGKSQLHDVLFYNLPNWIDVGLLMVMCVHVLTLIKVLCVRTKYVRTRVPSSLNTFCTRSIVSLLCKICQWCLCRVLRAFGQIKFSAYENKWRLQSMLVQSSLSTRRRIRVD